MLGRMLSEEAGPHLEMVAPKPFRDVTDSDVKAIMRSSNRTVTAEVNPVTTVPEGNLDQ
jgi:hypothetical protein